MKPFFPILFCFASVICSYGQTDTTANVRIFASPSEYYRIKIDGELQQLTSKFYFTPGTYNLSIWAPNYFQFDTVISIASEPIIVRKELKKTPELIKYNELTKQRNIEDKHIKTCLFSGLVFSSGALLNYTQLGNLKLNLIKAQYHSTYSWTGPSHKNDLSNSSRLYTAAVVLQGAMYAGIGVTSVLLRKFILKKRKIELPTLPIDNLFETVDIGILPLNQEGIGLSIRLNLAAK